MTYNILILRVLEIISSEGKDLADLSRTVSTERPCVTVMKPSGFQKKWIHSCLAARQEVLCPIYLL